MKAIIATHPGDEAVLQLRDIDPPPLPSDSVRIAVKATAVNRADLLQRRGLYPPPPGASEIIGMECAGTISEVGTAVSGWNAGDRVMALIPGGGYAQEAIAHSGSLMAIPPLFSDEEAAAFPEVFITAFLNLFLIGKVTAGETALVHGGGSGVGTAAIQLCRESNVRTFVTVGGDSKATRCRELGAAAAINYHTHDFVQEVLTLTGRAGVDIILDHLGASYLTRNIAALARQGRLIIIGSMGGEAKAELDVAALLSRRLTVYGSTLRARSNEEKARIIRALLQRFGAAIENGSIRPVIDRVLPLSQAAEAHRLMASSEHFGKIVLRVPN